MQRVSIEVSARKYLTRHRWRWYSTGAYIDDAVT